MTHTTPGITRRDFLKQLSLTSLAMVPALQTLGELVDSDPNDPASPAGEFLIDAAYRLMHYQNMLELEFYFLNVGFSADGTALIPLVSALEYYPAYMVVRLPQQHIAEQYVDAVCLHKDPEAQLAAPKESRIAGYSFLCFQIDFEQLPACRLEISAQQFMDWNAAHFFLISKPDNRIRPFVYDALREEEPADPQNLNYRAPDIYPLGYLTPDKPVHNSGRRRFNRRHYPNERTYPQGLRSGNYLEYQKYLRNQAPFTALEIPYRLIVSPRLPSWEYDYVWIFTSFIGDTYSEDILSTDMVEPMVRETELWMATLTLRKQQHSARTRTHKGKKIDSPTPTRDPADTTAPDGNAELINQAENQLQLMILGPAGLRQLQSGELQPPKGTAALANDYAPASLVTGLLPSEQDRLDLIRLSTGFDLPATTPSLTFTPLGVCTHISFRNKYYEKDRISLYQWKHAISFGRDQEVEVSNVVVDATFGLKMLHVRTTRRETTHGKAVLIYREFLLPLEPEKDFASYDKHDREASYQQPNGKYATPFQRVRFTELNARQILPTHMLLNDLCVKAPADDGTQATQQADQIPLDRRNPDCPYPEEGPPVLAFWAVGPDRRLLEWPMEFTDWRGETRTLRRRLYLLKSELNLTRTKSAPTYSYQPTDDAAAIVRLAAGLNRIAQTGLPAAGVRPVFRQTMLALRSAAQPAVMTAAGQLYAAFKANTTLKEEAINAQLDILWQKPEGDLLAVAIRASATGLPAATVTQIITSVEPATAEVWQLIRHRGEEYELHALDAVRSSLQTQLQDAEAWLVDLSTQGQRDVEDQVMEAWNLFKRRALSAQPTLEAELYWLRHQLEKLLAGIDRVAATVSGTTRAALASVRNTAAAILTRLTQNLDNFLAQVQQRWSPGALIADGSNVLQTHLQALLAALTRPVLEVLQNHVISDITAWQEALQHHLDSAVRKLITEVGHAYEQVELLKQLPAKIRAQGEAELRRKLDKVAALHTHIRHTEDGLRSRINAAKNRICYAVHQAEDEVETLKRVIDQKVGTVERTSEAWLHEFEKYRADFVHAASGHLTDLRTDFLVFRNNLRLIESQADGRKLLDFFSSYPCYPQLHTAQVYAGALDDLARREIPLKISYAADYVAYQVDNISLEVKNNAARVFAEVHTEARELLKGALREAGRDLGGLINPEVASQYLTMLKDGSARATAALEDLRAAGDEMARDLQQQAGEILRTGRQDLDNLLNSYKNNPELARYRGEFDRIRNGMLTLGHEAKNALKAAEQDVKVQASAFFQGLEAKILGSIRLRDLLGADFNLPKLTRLPDKVTYQFLTQNFKPLDVKVFRFIPNDQTSLSAYLEIPTRQPENFQSYTRLTDFTLGVFEDRLLVEFRHIELRSSRQQKNKTTVSLGKISFGKELEFLAALTKGFTIPGTGLKVEPSLSDISITYALPIPGISGGAFTFDNLKFVTGLSIPIPIGLGATSQPLAIKLGINSATDPFAVGVAIFGGMGHFQLETTPRYIRRVDAGLSFGGLFRINLVIASGQAYLQAGIRYIYQREETGESSMELYALLTCGANVTVFGFIDVSVVFTMYLKYTKDSAGSALYGVASVSYSVRIGFFRKSFTLTFSKRIAGADAPADQAVTRSASSRRLDPPAPRSGAPAPAGMSTTPPVGTEPLPVPAPAQPDRVRIEQLESQLETEQRRLAAQQARRDSIAHELDYARDPGHYAAPGAGGLRDPLQQKAQNQRDRQAQQLQEQARSRATLRALTRAYCFTPANCPDTSTPTLFIP